MKVWVLVWTSGGLVDDVKVIASAERAIRLYREHWESILEEDEDIDDYCQCSEDDILELFEREVE